MLAVLLLMDNVNGWLAVIVGLASHFVRSWIAFDPELHQLRSDLASFRSEATSWCGPGELSGFLQLAGLGIEICGFLLATVFSGCHCNFHCLAKVGGPTIS